MKGFTVASVFSDRMVLQRNKNINVFGTGIENAVVIVEFDGDTAKTVVQNGKWLAVLPPHKEAENLEMTIRCGDEIKHFSDIAVGEVWFAGGQSNMEFLMKYDFDLPETRELALLFMTVLSITVVGTSYQMPCLTGIVRGGGDTKFVLFNDIIFMWGIVLPSSFLAAFVLELPAVMIFICLKADQILKCFVAVVKVNRFRWIRKI